MAKPEYLTFLSSDKPLSDPKDDRLGYAPFAKHLAGSICEMTPTEGLVIAIHGSWGSGKSTLLNFVVYYLRQEPESQQPVIVQFNPWWFSGHEDLIRRFFDQLQAVLNKRQYIGKVLKKRLADFADLVSETPTSYALIGKIFKRLLTSDQKDVAELKAQVEDALRKKEKRILVIIDDIDRLTQDEIRKLFRVIKAIANFPKVIYLLAFDREVVIKALAQEQGISGDEYLEKIVQVPFELPLPDKTSLQRLLSEKLAMILADTPDELFDQTYWGNVYFDGIDHFIATPRDVVRLTNTLSVTYPGVKREVNPVDFIAIETLRVFCPVAYDIIRKNPGAFVGHADTSDFSGATGENLRSFHESWINQIPKEDKEPVKLMLKRLFPKLEAVWDNRFYRGTSWRKQLRICSPDKFPIYFRLAVPEGSVSNIEMKALLALTSNAKAFGAKLAELAGQKCPDGTTKVRKFLEHLEDYTEKEIPSKHIPSIVQALFNVGDQLLRPVDEQHGLFDFGNDVRVGRIIYQLLRRLDEPTRFELLKEAISKGKAITTIITVITTLGQQHGKYGARQPRPEEDRLISAPHLQELEKLALEKVRNAAEQGSLMQAPKLPRILYRWRDWAGEKECRQWVQKLVNNNDEGLVEFLEKFLQKAFSQSLSDRVGRTHYKLDPRELEPFLEPSRIIGRVRALVANEDSKLTDNQRIALEQFIRTYEMRQQGKDLNDSLAGEDK